MSTTVKRKGTFNRTKKGLDNAFKGNALIGIVGSKASQIHKDGIKPGASKETNAEIAFKHEFGLGGVPARHWLTSSFRGAFEKGGVSKVLEESIKSILLDIPRANRAGGGILKHMAKGILAETRKEYISGQHATPALAESTIEEKVRKGAPDPTRPVYRFGGLYEALDFKIESREKKA